MDHMVLTDHMASTGKNQTKKKVIQEHIVVEKDSINGDDAAPYTLTDKKGFRVKEKQEIRRIEIGIIQLVVVVFAAMVASKIPYTEITQGSIVLLGVVHVVSYYISSYYENLKYRGYLDELIATVKYCFIFARVA